MSELLTGGHLQKHQNILIAGPTGAGKTNVHWLHKPANNKPHSITWTCVDEDKTEKYLIVSF